jgi:hypothetical protein
MANEHTLVYEKEVPNSVTVADGAGIEKGTLLLFADPFTAAAATADTAICGVAAQEKIAGDGRTQLAVYQRGIFKATLSGSVTAGQALAASGSNQVKVATAADVGAKTLGIALETGTNGETILYELNPGCNNTAYA